MAAQGGGAGGGAGADAPGNTLLLTVRGAAP